MKAIILAGGTGSRLYPMTKYISKQLLPVNDKPMFYYPLSILMLAGIKNIAVVSDGKSLLSYKSILGNGSDLGIKIRYFVQKKPNGIPEVFTITKNFIKNDNVMLILGDNIFYGDSFVDKYIIPAINSKKPHIYGYFKKDPSQYGVVSFDKNYKIKKIEEKPKNFFSNYAIPGLYIFDEKVYDYTKKLKKSKRGELEVLDLINLYKMKNEIKLKIIERGVAWMDMGKPEDLGKASQFINTLEENQGQKIACIEEIAYKNNFIDKKKFQSIINKMPNSNYKNYLKNVE